MQLRSFILFFLIACFAVTAQDLKDDGDKYFYGYAYADAIKAYEKQMQQGEIISNHQLLNLADSYFKTGDYQSAAKIYLDINKRDSIMSDNRFNKMLQSLAKTSEPQRVRAFLKSKSDRMTNELMENATFNFEILEGNTNTGPDFNIVNLNTNSPQTDISPAFYKDKLLFSTSRKSNSKQIYGPSGESYLDIFEANIGQGGVLTNQSSFKRMPKVDYHKATPFYSEGLNSIFYVSSNVDKDGDLAFDSKRKNSLAIGLIDASGSFRYVLKDLSTSFYYPFYDDGSGKLYFAANFDDGYGGTDIYYVFTNEAQVMSEPVNLGPRINTPGNEIAPFIQDNSLYFSSDIFYGLGGMDIYKSNIQPDNSFSIPVNLGPGINSQADDFGMIIRPDDQGEGFKGYFASNRAGGVGNDDIYGFKVAGKPGLKTLVFQGAVVSSKTNLGVADVSVKLLDAERNPIKEVITGPDGAYRLEIPWREQVALEATKPKHSMYFKTFEQSSPDNSLETSNMNIEMSFLNDIVEEKENKTVLKLDNFFFGNGKSSMNPEVAKELIKVIGIIEQFPEIRLRIETHTSSKGRDSSNKRLSQARADAIRSYLLKNGVPKSNIETAIGYGETQIVNNCKNGVYCLDFLHDQNRRSLFVVLNFDELNE
ncbi:OmpA family protein [Aggregatimonas sangjinii]|uniref:OmpA family protein n=1 Tax=Aggregatimonas sangjinii TaxID=2583587 RepID=A0A5B7SV56_9FLAO|nr:OmpA family protein [Aggregatimonas sangjinii]QCX01169.1 OmpA family protein [Aggregatimonas sangjinii]